MPGARRETGHPMTLVHKPTCTDQTVRSSESIFDRGTIRHRCIGCGASVTVPKEQDR